MAEESSTQRPDLTKSTATIPSDSENYESSHHEVSPSPPSSARSPVILYKPPTFWSLVRGAAINLLLPFVNGLMLGFGELLAHEAAFRLGWSTYKVCSATGYLLDIVIGASLCFLLSTLECSGEVSHIILEKADVVKTQVFPGGRASRPIGPGIEVTENPRKRDRQLDDMTTLE